MKNPDNLAIFAKKNLLRESEDYTSENIPIFVPGCSFSSWYHVSNPLIFTEKLLGAHFSF